MLKDAEVASQLLNASMKPIYVFCSRKINPFLSNIFAVILPISGLKKCTFQYFSGKSVKMIRRSTTSWSTTTMVFDWDFFSSEHYN